MKNLYKNIFLDWLTIEYKKKEKIKQQHSIHKLEENISVHLTYLGVEERY